MEKEILKQLMARPGKKHKVADFNTLYTGEMTKPEANEQLQEKILQMGELQSKLYAHDRYAILIIFQAMDAAGKDGTIKHVMSGINPQGCQVYSFKQPSSEELDHDYMWRISKSLPERGRIGIFNRSHYEEVLVTKVHPEIILNQKLPDVNKLEDITDEFWQNRYRQINDFERHLTENGVVILKFFLNVSNEEQEKRFLARLDDESKNWKFSASDLKERAYWDEYMNAYSDMLTHTSTRQAPWYVIPADKKWFMRYAVADILCERMKELNLHYPELTEKAKIEIENARSIFSRDLLQKEESRLKAEIASASDTSKAKEVKQTKKQVAKKSTKSKKEETTKIKGKDRLKEVYKPKGTTTSKGVVNPKDTTNPKSATNAKDASKIKDKAKTANNPKTTNNANANTTVTKRNREMVEA